MKNKNILKRLSIIFFCLNVFFNILPVTLNAANTSVPGAEGHILTDIVTGTFSDGYDSTIIVYSTPGVSDSIKYNINDGYAIFEIPAYNNSQWYFDGWRTWYKGSNLGAGVINSDKANPKYNDELNYFERRTSEIIVDGKYYNAGAMSVYKEYMWKGTYYLSAIFKPILTVNAGEGINYSISGGSRVANDNYAVTYGNNASINYSVDSKYEVKKLSASYGTSYSESAGKVSVNTIEQPVTITIETALKSKATYTAPTAKDLTYNKQEQELVNKGISTDGILMYSLEENGAYSENVPTAKNTGDYTVWYYVKGDNNHNDSDKQYIKVTISPVITDIGIVSAEIPNDTTDISKVVLKRTNTTIPGNLKVKYGQKLVFGDNEIEYIFTPEDDLYKTVEGKVNVRVIDTISPKGTVAISGAKPTIWDKILETITFGLFFSTDQMVEVNVSDNLSGIHSIEYYESKEALNLNEIKTLSDENWKLMSADGVKVKAEDGKQFVYYIKVTDKAGNTMMMSTDGALFDTTAPIINGVEDGKTYNSTKTITITDNNLDSVKLNGEDATDTIVIEKDKKGTYEIVATDKAGNSSSVTFEIGQLNTDIGTVSAEIPNDITDVLKVILKRTNTTIPGSLKVKDGQKLVFGDNKIEYIFIPEDDLYKTVEGKVNVRVIDTISPIGTVAISGAKDISWNKVVETITFGLFFSTDQIVEVNVSDNLSGIHSIEYYESKEALNLNEIKTLSDEDWKLMSADGVKVKAEDGKQFVYYIKVKDKAGNTMMMSTDGALFDTIAPIINGVEDGKTYNSTKTITITDNNLDSVKLNGEDTTDTIVIGKDKNGTYEITATDKAGNASSVTIKIKNSSVNNPQTGDNIMLFVMIALASIVGIIVTIKIKNI